MFKRICTAIICLLLMGTLCACSKPDWKYDAKTHTLTVNSNTVMAAYAPDAENENGATTNAPWAEYLPEIETIVIGNNVTFIGDYTFAFCPLLKNVTVGENVISLGWRCFYRCSDWEGKSDITFTFNGTKMPTLGIDVFGYTWDNPNMKLYVSADTQASWSTAFENYEKRVTVIGS